MSTVIAASEAVDYAIGAEGYLGIIRVGGMPRMRY